MIEWGGRWHNVCHRKSRMPEPRIIVFLKAPRPGEVKTRLARYMGEKAACKAYIQLTETLLAKLTSLPQIEIRYTPDDAEEEILCWLRPGWTTAPQGTGELGMRMNRAFEETSCPTLLIGSDCPYLEPSDLKAAADASASGKLKELPCNARSYFPAL